MNRFAFIASAAALGLLAIGCRGGNQQAAVVNGESITMDQYLAYLQVKPQVQVIVNPQQLMGSGGQVPTQPYVGQVSGSLGLQALSDLVQKTLLKQMARDAGVFPSEQEITDSLNEKVKANPNFLSNLTGNGFTFEMIKNELAVELAQFKLNTQGITVTDADVNTFIQGNPKQFTQPETVDLAWVLVTDDGEKKTVDAELDKGTRFEESAQAHTKAPNKNITFPISSVPDLAKAGPVLPAEVAKTKEGYLTSWIKFNDGWARFKVRRRLLSKPVPIDDKVKKQVWRALMLQRGSQAKDVNKRLQERLKSADTKIEIMIPHLKEAWKNSLDSLNVNAGAPTDAKNP